MAISKTFFLASTLLAIALLALVLDTSSRPRRPAPRPLPTQLRISAPGRVEGSGEPSRLRFAVMGRMLEPAVSEGQFVEVGQLLLQVEPEAYIRELERTQAELEAASGRLRLLMGGARQQERTQAQAQYDAQRAELAQAEAAFNRILDLRRSDVATQQDFDRHRTQLQIALANVAASKSRLDLLQAPPREEELRVAQAHVDAAQASVALAQFSLRQAKLTAPVAGQVLRIGARRGELTGPQSPEPAIVLAQTERLSVRAFVDEIDASRVTVGMTGRITISGLPRQVTGSVVRVSPAVGPKTLWTGEPGERFDSDVREIWLELADTRDLVLGLRVDVLLDPSGPPEAAAAIATSPERVDQKRLR
jgi:multidrug resistance efflux pump